MVKTNFVPNTWEPKTRKEKILYYGLCIVLPVIIGITFFIAVIPYIQEPQHYYESAPNGVYDIYIVSINYSNSTVFGSMANPISNLHGIWKYDNTIWQVDKFFAYYRNQKAICEYFKVEIKNNIIIGVWQE